jgi:pyruvate,orthophosphate dikinase
MTVTPRVILIAPGSGDLEVAPAILGEKAAVLSRLMKRGLRVPPAIVLPPETCNEFHESGAWSATTLAELTEAIHRLETATELTFGGRWPLVVSVRPSAPTSMPGVLRSIINVGITERTVSGLIRRTGNPWFAWDAYRRLIRSFAETARGPSVTALLDRSAAKYLADSQALSIRDLDALSLRELVRRSADVLDAQSCALPQDPFSQLTNAIEGVLQSWNSFRAQSYRRLAGITEQNGTAVLIQTMVFGNVGCRSGSGVACTRSPITGMPGMYVDFGLTTQGDDIAAGGGASDEVLLQRLMPELWRELEAVSAALEQEFLDMQEFDFAIQDGELYVLESHTGSRTPWAALQIAVDLVHAGLIDRETASNRLAEYRLNDIVRETLRAPWDTQPVARGVPASSGVASGRIALDAMQAQQFAAGGAVVLVRTAFTNEDVAAMASAAGVITAAGGRISRAAGAARRHGKVCLVNCADLHVNLETRTCSFGGRMFREGDVLAVDGNDGSIYEGPMPVITERPTDAVATVMAWRDELRPNADREAG